MGSGCYLCEQHYGTITGQVNGDAVGACKLCGVFSCLAHGIRNPNRPAYVCGCCVPNLLSVAAVSHLGHADTSPPPSPGDHDALPDTPSALSQWALSISAVDDVIGDFADDHWGWMHTDMAYLAKFLVGSEAPAELRTFARPDTSQARHLMAAAVAFATKLNLPLHEMNPVLQRVAQAVTRHA